MPFCVVFINILLSKHYKNECCPTIAARLRLYTGVQFTWNVYHKTTSTQILTEPKATPDYRIKVKTHQSFNQPKWSNTQTTLQIFEGDTVGYGPVRCSLRLWFTVAVMRNVNVELNDVVFTEELHWWLSAAVPRETPASRNPSASASSAERSHWDQCTVLLERPARK